MTKTFIYYKKYNINYKDKRGVDKMTERIVEMMYRLNENIGDINLHLLRIEEMINRDNEINRVGKWILDNTCIDNPDYDKITVVMYCNTPRGRKIYTTTLNNIHPATKDFICLLDSDSDKIEMIHKDCIYQITLNTKGEEE